MIDQIQYHLLLSIGDKLSVTRQAVNNWKKVGKLPLTKALNADSLSHGKLNAYQLSGGYPATDAQHRLMSSVVEAVNADTACISTAHILNYLQSDQPPLYNDLLFKLSLTELGKVYLANRMMHTGEDSGSASNG